MQNSKKLNKWRTGSKLNNDNRSSSVTYNKDESTTFSNSKNKQNNRAPNCNRSTYGINSKEALQKIEIAENQYQDNQEL